MLRNPGAGSVVEKGREQGHGSLAGRLAPTTVSPDVGPSPTREEEEVEEEEDPGVWPGPVWNPHSEP